MTIDEILKVFCNTSSHLYFLLNTKENKIIYANPSFKSLFKDTPGELLSTMFAYIHPEDRDYVRLNFNACEAGEKNNGFECRIIVDQKLLYYQLFPVLIMDSKQAIIGCCAQEVTDMREYINNLNKHNEKKNSILNIVSHDLIGPIGIIQSISSHLSDSNYTPSATRLQQYVQLIDKTSKKCIKMIRNFITQEFLESAEVNLVKTRTEIVGKLNDLLEEYKDSELQLKKQFSLQSNKKKIYVNIDEDKFFQVINNLISNALKFTTDTGSISISIKEQPETITVSVADDGIGIPKKYHDQLFEKFNSARRKGLNGEESIGLGMSIIKTIVEWHQGKIYFESEENSGTTFHIEIPK